MRRLLKQRLLTVLPGYLPIIDGGIAPVTIVAEDRTDVQVILEGVGLTRIPERAILDPTHSENVLFRCDRLWKWGGLLKAVTVRVPCGFDFIKVHTRGRITVTGPVGYAYLEATKSIEVEEIPSNSSVSLRTTRRYGHPITVGKTSGDLAAWTKGGSVQIEADNPHSLFISTIGGDIDVHGRWDDQALDIHDDSGRVTLRKDT
ncbi:hypothetical protein NE236_04030 [Actinoallomurus purpureus]|uniref:hypothetical protein n=1 Tax=Actinoallomurus purpureus TaxID=478114 RepID=UPI002092918E|nr:hypothetical protein [Actinoallomurus purpureus]MCO6004139.1 hypothetical protein [Actinoallomurus purpureus]